MLKNIIKFNEDMGMVAMNMFEIFTLFDLVGQGNSSFI